MKSLARFAVIFLPGMWEATSGRRYKPENIHHEEHEGHEGGWTWSLIHFRTL